MRIADRSVLSLIRMYSSKRPCRRTGRSGTDEDHQTGTGNAAGGVISPLLANIYLHWFEKAFNRLDGPATWAKAKLVRYADSNT